MPVVAIETYNPGPEYRWMSHFTPDYAPTTRIVRDGSRSLPGSAGLSQRKLSHLSLHLHTSGHVHSDIYLSHMETVQSKSDRRNSKRGTVIQRRSSKSSLYAAQSPRRPSSYSATSRSATALLPGTLPPSSKSSRTSQSSALPSSASSIHRPLSAPTSARSTVTRSRSSRHASRASDAVRHQSTAHRKTHQEDKHCPEYAQCIDSGEIVRVDAPSFVPGSLPRTGPPASMYNERRSRSVKSLPVDLPQPKPKRTLAQRLGLKRRGMPIRPISGYRGRHHYPQHHGFFHTPTHHATHHSRPSHHGHGSSGSGWKFWKKGPAHHSSSSGWKGLFKKRR